MKFFASIFGRKILFRSSKHSRKLWATSNVCFFLPNPPPSHSFSWTWSLHAYPFSLRIHRNKNVSLFNEKVNITNFVNKQKQGRMALRRWSHYVKSLNSMKQRDISRRYLLLKREFNCGCIYCWLVRHFSSAISRWPRILLAHESRFHCHTNL